MQITTHEILAILGGKEIELALARATITQQAERIAELEKVAAADKKAEKKA